MIPIILGRTDGWMAYINVQQGFGKEGRVFEYSNGLIRKEKGQSKGFGFTLLRGYRMYSFLTKEEFGRFKTADFLGQGRIRDYLTPSRAFLVTEVGVGVKA